MVDEASTTVELGQVVPAPPRFTGDMQKDGPSVVEYLHQFYEAAVVGTELLNPQAQQRTLETIDPDNLPDPKDTTIATAQQIANEALTQANAAATVRGSFTISEGATSASVSFSSELSSAEYQLVASASSFTGNPGASAFVVVAVNKATTGFAVTIGQAPGSGNSITFDFILA